MTMPNRNSGAFNIKMTNTMKDVSAGDNAHVRGLRLDWLRRSVVGRNPGRETDRIGACRNPENKGLGVKIRAKSQRIERLRRGTRILRAAALCALIWSSFYGVADAEAALCLPPDLPMTALPASVLAEYRAEIATEFEGYFREVSHYIACLDAERARALAEARIATSSYSAFLDIPPPEKDLP